MVHGRERFLPEVIPYTNPEYWHGRSLFEHGMPTVPVRSTPEWLSQQACRGLTRCLATLDPATECKVYQAGETYKADQYPPWTIALFRTEVLSGMRIAIAQLPKDVYEGTTLPVVPTELSHAVGGDTSAPTLGNIFLGYRQWLSWGVVVPRPKHFSQGKPPGSHFASVDAALVFRQKSGRLLVSSERIGQPRARSSSSYIEVGGVRHVINGLGRQALVRTTALEVCKIGEG